MKRILCILLLTVWLCGWAVAEIIPSADSEAWVLVEVDTEVHARPDADSPTLGVAPAGSDLDYLGRTRDDAWYNVQGESGEGWINAEDATVMWSTLY